MAKRIILSTFLGFLAGIVCWQLSASGQHELHWSISVSIILSRTLLGFGIGISSLKVCWWLHGIVMGFVFSLPMAFSIFAGSNENAFILFLGTLFIGMIYGFVIELIVSIIFRMKTECAVTPKR